MDLSNENVIHIKKDNIEYLQFRKLLEYPEIKHAYSLGINRDYRTAKADKKALDIEKYNQAIENYKDLCNAISTNSNNLVKANQEHTDRVKIVEEKINKNSPDFNLEKYNQTDGLITNKNNIILSTTNADCILLLFYDPKTKTISNIHSGWKGTIKRIAEKTVEKMNQEFNSNPKDMICCICPSIRKCHFEVERDVMEKFKKEFYEFESTEFIEEKIPNKKWNIDTVYINKKMLEKKRLKPENIIDSKICSMCNSNLIHSYRAEKEGYGLSTAIIEIN